MAFHPPRYDHDPTADPADLWASKTRPTEFIQRQRVVLTVDGDVVRGQVRVADAIVEAALAHNPSLIEFEIARWITENKAADDKDRVFSRKWDERLSGRPQLADALDKGAQEIYRLAGLTDFQARAVELHLEGNTPSQIALALGLNSRQAAQDRISKALGRLLELNLELIA